MRINDVLCFLANQSHNHLFQSALDSEIVALESAFTPAILSSVVGDLDHQPARLDAEIFDALDFGHCEVMMIIESRVKGRKGKLYDR